MPGAVSARAYGKLKFDVPVFLLSIRKENARGVAGSALMNIVPREVPACAGVEARGGLKKKQAFSRWISFGRVG